MSVITRPPAHPAARELAALRGRLLQAARRAVPDADEAEDVCQEVLTRSWAAMHAGRCVCEHLPRHAFATYRNVLHEARRDRQRRALHTTQIEVRDPRPDPLRLTVLAERAREVRAALAALRAEDRELLQMTLVDGLTCAQIARRAGLPPATVRQRKHRALRLLAAQLSGRA